MAAVTVEWLASMRRRNFSEKTIRRRRINAERFDRWMRGRGGTILAADTADVAAWLDGLQVTPQTISHYRSDLGQFYAWAQARQYLTENPVLNVENPQRPRYLPRPIGDDDLAGGLLQSSPKMRCVLALAALAGLRAAEIAALDVADGLLYIRQGKGQKDRVVPVSAALAVELERYGVPKAGPVIARERGGRYTAGSISTMASKHFAACGIGATLHQLRHYFGTCAYAGTGDLRAVQDLLGHSSPQTTALYTRVSSRMTRDAVEAVSLPA